MRIAARGSVVVLLAITIGGGSTGALAQQPSVTGLWLDNEGRGAVEITRCDRSLCGRIVWLKDPADKDGKPWNDMLNPIPSQRETPVCGLQVLGELKRETDGNWTGGWIYDPEQGRRFNVEVSIKDANALTVYGYDKDKVKSETMNWTRLPDSSPRCK